jgi:hypothetical protein
MKPSFLSRLQRLEARTETGAGRNALGRERELEQFNRAAEQYIRAVRQYLHEPLENEVCLPCPDESEKLQVANQLMVYHLRYLRQYAREGPDRSPSCGEAQEPSGETRSAFGSHRQ